MRKRCPKRESPSSAGGRGSPGGGRVSSVGCCGAGKSGKVEKSERSEKSGTSVCASVLAAVAAAETPAGAGPLDVAVSSAGSELAPCCFLWLLGARGTLRSGEDATALASSVAAPALLGCVSRGGAAAARAESRAAGGAGRSGGPGRGLRLGGVTATGGLCVVG